MKVKIEDGKYMLLIARTYITAGQQQESTGIKWTPVKLYLHV